ncbi:Ni/Fe hydrogenase subunit alpha [Geoalkalibacter sp.]|uniref:Ni/Fe hydrogenase subunit alpha n=1 Tax=Geoalkalibacter sp. TaxID=3041440 RepID=UPI00272E29DB|nr:nickel-dependent hydrogenase large subunit [Geoalkalibacter sp.]
MKRLCLEPLTRVEGHGRIELELENGRLSAARVALTESPRFFEGFLPGRPALEVPSLVCRICAICSGAHRVAAVRALEQAWQVDVPPVAARIRELLLLGGLIESHALHLFCLILPDLHAADSILALLRQDQRIARRGLALKAFGNQVQELAGGRVIHPINVEPGGVLFFPEPTALARLAEAAARWQDELPELLAVFGEAQRFPTAAAPVGRSLSLAFSGALSLSGERLRVAGLGDADAAHYGRFIQEQTLSYSHARRSLCQGAPLLAGALARANNGFHPPAPDAAGPTGIHANNWCQARELGQALAQVRTLAEHLSAEPREVSLRAAVRVGPGTGTGLVEAPRGLLIHHYGVDDLGRIAAVDILTPTAINQAAMEAQLLADLADVQDEAALSSAAERIVRAYDPCISCAVHVLRR